jgi:hypothetical protein
MKRLEFFVIGVLVVATGCMHTAAVYMPAASGPGAAPAVFPVPQQDPKGSIEVVSLGGEHLAVGSDGPDMYLHLRIIAHNQGDAAVWTVDPMEQVATYEGLGRVGAAFVEASPAHTPPVLSLATGQSGALEVYYPLPDHGDPPRVSIAWQVRRGTDVVTSTAVFDRVSGRSDGYYTYAPYSHWRVGVGLGWWWYPGWVGAWGWGGGWGGYYGRGYYGGYGGYRYGGYGGYRGYSGGGARGGYGSPAWRSPAPSGGMMSAPRGGGGGGGKSGWRGGGRR